MSRLSLPGLLPALPQDVFFLQEKKKGAVLGLQVSYRRLIPETPGPMGAAGPPHDCSFSYSSGLWPHLDVVLFQAVTAPMAWRAWSGRVVRTGWVGETQRGYGDSFSRTF